MSEETRTLKEQFEEERYKLENALADALSDFTERTGFIVKGTMPNYHDYRSSGQAPYYSVSVSINA